MTRPVHHLFYWLGICLLLIVSRDANAQNYTLTSTASTFTALGGSIAADVIEVDEGITDNIQIGFTFNYYGSSYTQLRASSNGFITFNGDAATTDFVNNLISPASFKVIAPLWDDLSGVGGAASYTTSGIAPYRVFTMEWLNWQWNYTAGAPVISFQVRLYEGSNTIEFIYRQETAAVSNSTNGASIGLVGNAPGQFYSLSNSSTTPALDPNGKNDISTKPATGQLYTFATAVAPAAPLTQATNLTFSSITGSAATLSWTNGSGSYRHVVVKRTTSTSDIATLTLANDFYKGANSDFKKALAIPGNTGWVNVYNGTGNTVTITNLDAGYTYRAQVIEYNGLGGQQKYLSAAGTNNPNNVITVLAAPIAPFSTLAAGALTTSSVDLVQSGGNGTSIVVFAQAGSSGTSAPVDNTTYTANPVFGSGTQIGTTGWYCVYNGERSGSLGFIPTITGLTPNTAYRFHVVDYNGPAGSEKYSPTSVTNNPFQLSTFPSIPPPLYTFAASAGSFTPLVGGTDLNEIEADDIISVPIPIGFTFRMAGIPTTQLRVGSDGFITANLLSTTGSTNVNALSSTMFRPMAAPLWDDLTGAGGHASYQTSGSAPNRVFTFEWLNWKWNFSATAANISMQVKLYESDYHMEYIYRQEAGTVTSSSASIGLSWLDTSLDNFLSLNNTTANPSASNFTETDNLSTRPANGQVYSFTPSKIDQSIVFNALPSKDVTDAPFTLTATATSGLPVTYTSSNTAVATVSGNTVTIVALGSADITASQTGDKDFAAAPNVIRTLIVGHAQTITFGALPVKTFGDANFALSGTSSSGLTVNYSSSNTAVATISGSTVTIVGAGTTDITASQPGNSSYVPAANVIRTLTVNKANQTITFNPLAATTIGQLVLTATSSSGLPVSYTASNNHALVSNINQLTLVSPGHVTISADQQGNVNYNAATQVTQTICINPAKPSFTVNGINTENVVLTSSEVNGNQWFNNNVAINGATNSTYTVTAPGSYTVIVSVDNCSSVPSDSKIFVVTDVEKSTSEVTVYPNPVKDQLTVDISGLNATVPALLSIYDVTGGIVLTSTIQGQLNIEVGQYPAGMYLLKIQDGKSTIIKKIIKN